MRPGDRRPFGRSRATPLEPSPSDAAKNMNGPRRWQAAPVDQALPPLESICFARSWRYVSIRDVAYLRNATLLFGIGKRHDKGGRPKPHHAHAGSCKFVPRRPAVKRRMAPRGGEPARIGRHRLIVDRDQGKSANARLICETAGTSDGEGSHGHVWPCPAL